jgi:UDP-3-O-[3-hydroxymyristoyl] N-acetylglucosamine deacetylase
MDGSAAPFVYLIQQAGIRAQARMRRRIVIRRPIEVRDGNRWVRVMPSREFKLSVEIDYAHPAIGRQALEGLVITPELFAREIAPARTFGFLKDTQRLQAIGLAPRRSLCERGRARRDARAERRGLRFRTSSRATRCST